MLTEWLIATASSEDDDMLGAAENPGSLLPAASCSLDAHLKTSGLPLRLRNLDRAASADCQKYCIDVASGI